MGEGQRKQLREIQIRSELFTASHLGYGTGVTT